MNKLKRPLIVTWFGYGVLIILVTHIVQFITTIKQWDLIHSLGNSIQWRLVISSLIWIIILLYVAFILFFRQPKTLRIVKFTLALYIINFWFDKIIISSSPTNRINDDYAILATFSFAFITLFFYKAHGKKHLGDINE